MVNSTRVRRDIQVPCHLHGKIIGKGHATLQDIEETTGASVEVPGRESTSETVVVTAPDQQSLNDAVRRIGNICDMDFDLGETRGEKYRRLAHEEGNYERRQQLNQQAAEAIFEEKNRGRDPDEMDLHGLYVEEALHFTKQRMMELESGGSVSTLKVITGKGLHSEGGEAKIRPAVIEMMQKEGYDVDQSDPGALMVTLRRGAVPPSQPQPQGRGLLGTLLSLLSSCLGLSGDNNR